MITRVDPDTLGFVIADVSRLLRAEYDRRIAEAGLGVTPGEARALGHAARAGTVRQNILAERMGVEAMTLSTYADRLEARGLVTRTPDPSDRRAKLISTTDAADGVLEAMRGIGTGLRQDAAAGMSAEDWNRMLDLLKTLRGNLMAMRTDTPRETEGTAA